MSKKPENRSPKEFGRWIGLPGGVWASVSKEESTPGSRLCLSLETEAQTHGLRVMVHSLQQPIPSPALQRNGEPEVAGEPQEVAGEPQEVAGEPQEVAGEPQEVKQEEPKVTPVFQTVFPTVTAAIAALRVLFPSLFEEEKSLEDSIEF